MIVRERHAVVIVNRAPGVGDRVGMFLAVSLTATDIREVDNIALRGKELEFMEEGVAVLHARSTMDFEY